MSVQLPNLKLLTLTETGQTPVFIQRGKKFRLGVVSGGSTFTVNGFLMTAEEATALKTTRQKYEIVASGTGNIAAQQFDEGFVELEFDLTSFSSDLTAEISQVTPARSS